MGELGAIPKGRGAVGGENVAAAGAAQAAISAEEQRLVAALRNREERAFVELVNQYHAGMLCLATIFVSSRALAEDVVQETWLGVLRGIDRFEGRSSLKTWVYRILVNRAKSRAEREGRNVPFAAASDPAREPAEPAVDPERFLYPEHPEWPGHWLSPPVSWGPDPERLLLAQETREHIQAAIQALPPNQREVITLRDVEQWSAPEVCNVLGISETNQRVLLHRARSRVRGALEQYLGRG